jgi:outer membrane protein assembly factor BamA
MNNSIRVHFRLAFLLACFLPSAAGVAAAAQYQSDNRSDHGRIIEIRFRGNFTIPDDTLLRLGEIAAGMPWSDFDPDEVKQRLLRSGRLEGVEFARRYRGFNTTDEIVLVITVKEKQSLRSRFMYFPILAGSDEYGFTYGFRSTAVDLLGSGERLSIPLTWGGTRRAALEGEFRLSNPVVQTLTAEIGLFRREHPFYGIGDFRKEAHVGIKRRFDRFEMNLRSGWTDVSFGRQHADFASIGAGATFDTRRDSTFPRDAVYAEATWKRLVFPGGDRGFNRYTLDFRGYKSVVGQTVLAGQIFYHGADGHLPDWERPFLGGATTLRGHQPGAYIGDTIATASLELRMPLTPLQVPYHAGVDFFFDTGTVYDYGRSLGNAKFRHGAGVGGFFLFMGLGVKVDIAYDLRENYRAHFRFGIGSR